MNKHPRIGGTWWPVFLALFLALLLPIGLNAQEATEVPDEAAGTDEAIEESTVGDETVVTDDGSTVTETPDETEISEISILEVEDESAIEPDPDFDFVKPEGFRVVDWPSDEGGQFAIIWGPSDSDEIDTVEGPAPGGQYMVFHSEKGPDGPWRIADRFPSNTRYTWEEPSTFGFFLSELRRGKNEHYSQFSNAYPPTGLYEYGIFAQEDDPGSYYIYTKVYDRALPDYANIRVFCDLKPLRGPKVQLEYEPPDHEAELHEWDNTYSTVVQLDELGIPYENSKLKTSVSYYVLFTAQIRGHSKGVLKVQPTLKKPEDFIVINSDGGETPVPDNRFPHWFRVYAAPMGYVLPPNRELPPEAWLIGASDQVIAKGNIWNVTRTNTFLWAIFICGSVLLFIYHARGGKRLFVRRIAGLDHVEEAIGRATATEVGRPILYSTGLGGVSDIATIASMNILGQVARKVADYDSRIMVPNRDPIVMAVCQELVQEAYIDAGRPDACNKDDVFFVTDDQFAYTAAVDGIMMREKPATNFFMGMFFAESLLLAETGASTGAVQIAGTDALAQLPFFITACDYTLIGEELYAASAYLSHEPLLLGSLKGQDLSKMVFMIAVLIGTIWICVGAIPNLPLPNPEFFKQLFQAF